MREKDKTGHYSIVSDSTSDFVKLGKENIVLMKLPRCIACPIPKVVFIGETW